MDEYEKGCAKRIKELRYLLMDALCRSDDGLSDDDWERGQWGYAYIQLTKAKVQLDEMVRTVLVARRRYLELQGDIDSR